MATNSNIVEWIASNREHQNTGIDNLYLCLISIHGLIRGSNQELGRDADTGGQTKYVVELARALAQHPNVSRVDLLTRRVDDPAVDEDYAQPEESLGGGARIVRIEAGPAAYIAKEALWDYLDAFVDNAINYISKQPQQPDILHSHYADAGYVSSRICHILDIPLIHTGHSLGRVKRMRLLATGLDTTQIDKHYNMLRRVEAEEMTLAASERVITSTHHEIDEQYGLYDYYQPEQMQVIPPGTDLSCFHPPEGGEWNTTIAAEISRFLQEPERPIILALSRPDARKNISTLITAFGEDKLLQEHANLVVVVGNREDIHDLDAGAQDVITELLFLIDHYDLYGKVAYPKHHSADDVPIIYRLATLSGGVFVNPALTEPFGLTLIEAAASGLPIVATNDGGPNDIIKNCCNGLLVDPLDSKAVAKAISSILMNWEQWQQRSTNGLKGVREHYSWEAHAKSYLEMIRPIIKKTSKPLVRLPQTPHPMRYRDRAIFTDLDQNLLGDTAALAKLISLIRGQRKCTNFGIATGRRLDSALAIMKRYGIPDPDVLITSSGSAIHYAPKLTEDAAWTRHIEKQWTPQVVRRVLDALPGLKLQPKQEQSRFKVSYYIDPSKAPSLDEINQILHQEEQAVNVTHSFGQFLDILPLRASKGLALRYFAAQQKIPLEQILVAGGSGADEDMMRGNTLAVVAANRHHEELSQLESIERIYFAQGAYAEGILEALEYYDFFASCRVPETKAVLHGK